MNKHSPPKLLILSCEENSLHSIPEYFKSTKVIKMMSSSLKLNNDTLRMHQSVAALAIVSMKNWYEDPKGKEEIKQQIPDLRHQRKSLRLVQGAGRWNQTGTALKSKEDKGTWKVLSAASSKPQENISNPFCFYPQSKPTALNLQMQSHIFCWKCTIVVE